MMPGTLGALVRQFGDTAVVTGRTRIRARIREILHRFTDVFVRTERRWHAVPRNELLATPP
jgi:hypothetical protein